MHYDVHRAVADGSLVVVNCTMNGRHTAPWAVYAEDGSVDNVFPPTGRTFANWPGAAGRDADGAGVT